MYHKSLTVLMAIIIIGIFIGCATTPPPPEKTQGELIIEQCWEEWPGFQRNTLPVLKQYYSMKDLIVEKGVSNKLNDIKKMHEIAVSDAREKIAGAIKTDIGKVDEVFSRSFQDYALEIPGSNRELAESFYRGIVNGAVEMNRELGIYDFTPIEKGYWVVRYISTADLEIAQAREMLERADIITQLQRDEFLKRNQEALDAAKEKSEALEQQILKIQSEY